MKNSKRSTLLKHSETYRYSENPCHNPENSNNTQHVSVNSTAQADLKSSLIQNKAYLTDLLLSLDGVIQSPQYHPESDALFHSLQVFELAYLESKDPELWLAALFHDVGKAVDSKLHAEIGAEMVSGCLPDRVVWLIAHHLDLMMSPAKTQQRLSSTKKLSDAQKLTDLVKLRAWDVSGRNPNASVGLPDEALELIITALPD